MAHSFDAIYYHIIFSTKYRDRVLNGDIRQELFEYISGVVGNKHSQLILGGGIADHIHLLVRGSRTIAPAQLVSAIKTNSSRWVKDTNPMLSHFAWQVGYGIVTVGYRDRDRTYQYIAHQEQHHATTDYAAEMETIAKAYGVVMVDRD